MLGSNQRIWGYETNFGGLADLSVVKANQLMPKPEHLSWEEAAVNALCNSTSYRMLVSPNGAHMKQGDVVLIWGATGGIGAYATQYVLNGGGIPIGVVSSADKAEILRGMGVEAIIDRRAGNYHTRRKRMEALRWRHSRTRRRRPRHCVRTPWSFNLCRINVRSQEGRHRSNVCSNQWLHDGI
jgi:NADPH:quinone reductase-like Zn-dependent oxidoreductase